MKFNGHHLTQEIMRSELDVFAYAMLRLSAWRSPYQGTSSPTGTGLWTSRLIIQYMGYLSVFQLGIRPTPTGSHRPSDPVPSKRISCHYKLEIAQGRSPQLTSAGFSNQRRQYIWCADQLTCQGISCCNCPRQSGFGTGCHLRTDQQRNPPMLHTCCTCPISMRSSLFAGLQLRRGRCLRKCKTSFGDKPDDVPEVLDFTGTM